MPFCGLAVRSLAQPNSTACSVVGLPTRRCFLPAEGWDLEIGAALC